MERKTQWSPWTLQAPPVCKHLEHKMQTQNGQGCHWELLPYDNGRWKCELDKINTSMLKKISKAYWPLFVHLPLSHKQNYFLSLMYTIMLMPQIYPILHSH